MLRRAPAPLVLVRPVALAPQIAALVLALSSLLLALAALGPVPSHLVGNPLAPKELGTTLVIFLGGGLLALGLARGSLFPPGATSGPSGALRRAAGAAGVALERLDAFARRWTSASLLLPA